MTSSRRLVNLVTVVLASAVLLLFAVTQLLASAILDNSYPLYVELSAAGGLLENKQVTYRGVAVGEIIDVTLCDDATVTNGPSCADINNVRVEMGIDDGIQIPTDVDVVVLRQSAVGEQALDIRPREGTELATPVHEEGDVLRPDAVTLPTKPQDLLEVANRVFAPIDDENAGLVVSELAAAVQGRSTDLRRIMADSAVLSEAVADNGGDYDRFFAASRIVNASLAENREILAQLITDLADGAELIGDIRSEVDGLLDTAPPVLATTTTMLEQGDANLSCVIEDLGDLNTFVNLPENRANLEEALRVNEYFFHAFRVIGPDSAQGDPWLRVLLIMEPEPPPLLYTPPRPIPPTLPGGACDSVFGPGAGSAVQANHQLAAPEGQVIRPENDRHNAFAADAADPDRSVAGSGRPSTHSAVDDGGGDATTSPGQGQGPVAGSTASPVDPDGAAVTTGSRGAAADRILLLVALAAIGFLVPVGALSAAGRIAGWRAGARGTRPDRARPDRTRPDREGPTDG